MICLKRGRFNSRYSKCSKGWFKCLTSEYKAVECGRNVGFEGPTLEGSILECGNGKGVPTTAEGADDSCGKRVD